MTTPGGETKTEQPSSALRKELAAHTPLMPVASDPTQAPWLLRGQGEPQGRKVSATRATEQSRWGDVPGF